MIDWSKLEKLANDYVAKIDGDDDDLYQEARDMFEDACDTTTILALIAENKAMRKALILAKPCVNRDMNAAVRENFGIVGNDPWASSAVDARDAIVEVLA